MGQLPTGRKLEKQGGENHQTQQRSSIEGMKPEKKEKSAKGMRRTSETGRLRRCGASAWEDLDPPPQPTRLHRLHDPPSQAQSAVLEADIQADKASHRKSRN
ncbi:hypothetical protein HA466_0016880 [Hirschfeldia incana]|nr:hypothetical protein HA466_0016880 [Hirschfeldia incana]